jgi:hypothetical protein
MNWLQPPTYLVYALVRHCPISSIIILGGGIVLGAPATFRSRKLHLPVEYRTGKKLLEVEDAMSRLVERYGRGIPHEKAIDLRVHDNPDGKYLIKGGGRKIWKRFRLRKEHRRLQGIIYGKRCGTTQNIGPAARGS